GAIEDLGACVDGDDTHVAGISGDGRTIVGWTQNSWKGAFPYRWTEGEGWELIPGPPGSSGGLALDTNADGSVVVGGIFTPDSDRAFRWTESGTELLGVPPGAIGAWAQSASEDGKVI